MKQATGLPPSLSHFVFCQYSFWGSESTVVPPVVEAGEGENSRSSRIMRFNNESNPLQTASFVFNNSREFVAPMTEEFVEYCSEGALSVEVYGHRSAGFESTWDPEEQKAKAQSLADR